MVNLENSNTNFCFKHAGKASKLAWLKYKAKECWFLSRSVYHVTETQDPALILHNSVASKLRITEDFVTTRARELGLEHARFANIADACQRSMVVQVMYALLLLLLPVRLMRSRVQATIARCSNLPQRVVVFCDAHLAGVILVEAVKRLGVQTATLQHGLYRADDIGSRMAFENFVADKILLWDEITKLEFLEFGFTKERLQVCGQYGFSHLLTRRTIPQSEKSVAICPPYDRSKVPLFLNLAKALPPTIDIKFSLHPILQQVYPNLRAEPFAAMIPRPGCSICGDGGVIMESLASGIPVISLGKRPLAGAHLNPEGPDLTLEAWEALVSMARTSYENDLKRFGFTSC